MEVRVLGCSGGRSPGLELSSYLIDSSLLIDTGALSSSLTLPQQETITDILITHAHLDHVAGLAFLYLNTSGSRSRPVDVYATEPVIREIKEHLFSPEILPAPLVEQGTPGINFHSIVFEIPFKVGYYEVEAFPVNHSPGSVAYRVSDSDHTLLFTGDTGRTDRVWEWVRKRGGVDCLIAEVSFPDRLLPLADASRHLTPATLIESLRKAEIHPDHKVHLVHLKPAFMGELLDEIEALRDWNLIILRRGDVIRMEKGEQAARMAQPDVEDKVRDKEFAFDADADLYEQRKQLAEQFGVTVSAGDAVFRQGDRSRIMYIVQEGKVRIYRSAPGIEKTLAIVGPGDFFGEMAMLNNRPRSATAQALTDIRLLAFDKNAFEKLVVNNFGVALRIIRTLAIRLADADTLIENLLYLDPQSKVVNTLIQTAYDEGIETSEGYLVRTTPEKLADKSGVVLPTLRRIMAEMVEQKFIVARKEALVIPNIPRLRRLLKFLELKDEFS
ncbi:MAG TPA: cyclic nucleotide-binding domain-containing protein [bacterium]|nr:cyclic nucleotide-binding domain-containing protein [bacterium]